MVIWLCAFYLLGKMGLQVLTRCHCYGCSGQVTARLVHVDDGGIRPVQALHLEDAHVDALGAVLEDYGRSVLVVATKLQHCVDAFNHLLMGMSTR